MGIVRAESIKIAGNAFDLAIAEYIEQTRNVIIGLPTAEKLKMECGSAFPRFDSRTCTVAGMDKLNSHKMGTTLTVSGGEIREALKEPLDMIAEAIEHTLKITPPELSADIFDFGIMLAGGGALLGGLPALITERTGVRVTVAKRPLDSVALGIGRVIEGNYSGVAKYRAR
jgi:rod shape-determining protein MreB